MAILTKATILNGIDNPQKVKIETLKGEIWLRPLSSAEVNEVMNIEAQGMGTFNAAQIKGQTKADAKMNLAKMQEKQNEATYIAIHKSINNPKNSAIIFFIFNIFLNVGTSTCSGTLALYLYIKSVNKYNTAMTTINTAAENSMKLTFLSTPGLNSMRTVKKAHRKPATTTANMNHKPKGMKQKPMSDINRVFIAASTERPRISQSERTV